MSTLERLFTYAKASEVAARENFTTEALAGAIRIEPDPFLAFLREGLLLGPGPVRDLGVNTQVVVPGTGYLDLVVSCVSNEHRVELWGELKIEAGESGTQLDAYQRHIDRLPSALRPKLFTLGPRPLRHDGTIPFLSWHSLRRELLAQDVGPAWLDFAEYLSEISVSDDFDQPVSAHEAASMPDFLRLHGKVARILHAVSAQASKRWPDLGWPQGETAIRKDLGRRFWEHRDLLVLVQPRGRGGVVYVALGAVGEGSEAAVRIDVGTWPAQGDLQRELIDLADRAAMPATWQRSFGNWGGVRITERLVTLGDHATAERWFLERLDTLADAGILGRISAVGQGATGPGDNLPEPEIP